MRINKPPIILPICPPLSITLIGKKVSLISDH